METELWPNLVREAKRARVPVYLANARLSQKSAAGYRRFAALTREVLQGFRGVAAEDAERLRSLGAQAVTVTGNLKFDVAPPPAQLELGAHFRALLGPRPVWLAASTRDGEEALIVEAFRHGAPADALLLSTRWRRWCGLPDWRCSDAARMHRSTGRRASGSATAWARCSPTTRRRTAR